MFNMTFFTNEQLLEEADKLSKLEMMTRQMLREKGFPDDYYEVERSKFFAKHP